MKLPLAALALALGGQLASCAAEGGGAPLEEAATTIEDRDWRLAALGGAPVAIPPGARSPELRFEREAATVRGHGGVNSFFGPYALEGGVLRIERLASTRMAGPPEAMQLEVEFLGALESVRTWRFRGAQLELCDEAGIARAAFAGIAGG